MAVRLSPISADHQVACYAIASCLGRTYVTADLIVPHLLKHVGESSAGSHLSVEGDVD